MCALAASCPAPPVFNVLVYKQTRLVKKRRRRRPHARAHAPDHILTSVGHPTNNRSDPTDHPTGKRAARLADEGGPRAPLRGLAQGCDLSVEDAHAARPGPAVVVKVPESSSTASRRASNGVALPRRALRKQHKKTGRRFFMHPGHFIDLFVVSFCLRERQRRRDHQEYCLDARRATVTPQRASREDSAVTM